MAHPFPSVDQSPLRRLTQKGIATFRDLNERDDKKLTELREVRASLMAEVASVDDVMDDLRETIARREAKMRGDVISLLPTTPQPDEPKADVFAPTQTFEPGLPPEREAAAERFNAAHDELTLRGES